MKPALLLTALAALAGPAGAQADAPAPAPELREMAPAAAAPGWTKQSASLLLYGADGALAQEVPLRDPDAMGATSRETTGGVSPDRKLAWTLDRTLVYTRGRTKLLESRRLFKVYGSDGQELWRDDAVDVPERGEPVQWSADGRTLLLAGRSGEGWSVEARTWLGRPIARLGPFPKLISMALTPNGRFALARWAVPDKSDTHTFIDLQTKARKDVDSADLVLGLARIGDDGAVRSGSKTVYAFDLTASTSTAK